MHGAWRGWINDQAKPKKSIGLKHFNRNKLKASEGKIVNGKSSERL